MCLVLIYSVLTDLCYTKIPLYTSRCQYNIAKMFTFLPEQNNPTLIYTINKQTNLNSLFLNRFSSLSRKVLNRVKVRALCRKLKIFYTNPCKLCFDGKKSSWRKFVLLQIIGRHFEHFRKYVVVSYNNNKKRLLLDSFISFTRPHKHARAL